MTEARAYDAVVIGGGHNGLINGAYLAKAGLKTLILERRNIVGGAAITEELYPGFQFTTFSYALSHIRPHALAHGVDAGTHGERRLPAVGSGRAREHHRDQAPLQARRRCV